MIDYLERILDARVYDVAVESPLERATRLSTRLHNHVWLKREDTQSVFSFKLRGAYNKMARMHAQQRARGVITASAGNHAQGVALAARTLACQAHIVMPVTTPAIKVDAVRRLGAQVILMGDNFDAAYAHARELESGQGLTFVHPFDDPDVIAGQGTVGMEILRQHGKPIDALFVPVGGGGLICGVAAYVKRLRPSTQIIGVEAFDADALYQSLQRGERVRLGQVGLFADGAAVKQVGEENFRLARTLVDEVVRVDTDEICAAIKDVFEDTRSILEPAGALAIAGLKHYVLRTDVREQTLIAIASGANTNFDRLRFVAERAEVGEQREAVLAVTIPELPGSFRRLCALLGPHNVTEFNYRYSEAHEAHVFLGLQVSNREESHQVIESLREHHLPVLDLTDDELAKLHLRHLVGGRAREIEHELLYRFVFPERPGALMKFLDNMGSDWNITLFHYRNHGADYARVLVGVQVPARGMEAFRGFLERLGYEYSDESSHPAYRLFLG